MPTTYSTDLINPTVYSLALMADVNGNAVLRQFSTVYPELTGQPGDTLSLVEYTRLTELAANATETVSLTPEALEATDNQLVIGEAASAVTVSWRARHTSFGQPLDIARSEQARIISNRVDNALRAAAETAAGAPTPTGANISYAAIIGACAPFGDGLFSGEVSLVCHSKQLRDLLLDSDFQIQQSGQGAGPGFVGTLGGGLIPVYVSDLCTVDTTVPETPTYTAILLKGKPLAYGHKADIEVATSDDVLARTTTIVSSLLYVAGVVRPERIALIETR